MSFHTKTPHESLSGDYQALKVIFCYFRSMGTCLVLLFNTMDAALSRVKYEVSEV